MKHRKLVRRALGVDCLEDRNLLSIAAASHAAEHRPEHFPLVQEVHHAIEFAQVHANPAGVIVQNQFDAKHKLKLTPKPHKPAPPHHPKPPHKQKGNPITTTPTPTTPPVSPAIGTYSGNYVGTFESYITGDTQSINGTMTLVITGFNTSDGSFYGTVSFSGGGPAGAQTTPVTGHIYSGVVSGIGDSATNSADFEGTSQLNGVITITQFEVSAAPAGDFTDGGLDPNGVVLMKTS